MSETSPSPSNLAGIAPESYLANRLLEAGEITDTEHSFLVNELERRGREPRTRPLSAIQVLEQSGFKKLVDVLLFLARDSATPLLPLSRFGAQKAAYSLVPRDYLTERGALPFGTLESAVLVALLNPYDKALREQVQNASGRSCKFYLVKASEYDAALSRIVETESRDVAQA